MINRLFYIAILSIVLGFLAYYGYWFYGPPQVKQLSLREEKGIYSNNGGQEVYLLKHINNRETLITVKGVPNVSKFEKYYIEKNKDKIELYILTDSPSTQLPFAVVHSMNYQDYIINKNIDSNHIDVYIKGAKEKKFNLMMKEVSSLPFDV